MGASYGSMIVFGIDADEIAARVPRPAFISTASGSSAVFSRADDEFESTGAAVSAAVQGVTLSVLVQDSDMLAYLVHRDGVEILQSMAPDPAMMFGDEMSEFPGIRPDGNALANAVGRGDSDVLQSILTGDYTFAEERHADLLAALGLPAEWARWGYRYLTESVGEYEGPPLRHLE
jgi:hypothetical protein